MAAKLSSAIKLPALRRAARSTVDLLFPPSCLNCNASLNEFNDVEDDSDVGFCETCTGEMQRGDWPVCLRCASRVPKLTQPSERCGHCQDQKLWFDRTLALGDYDGILREQCLAMKTDRSERLATAVGKLMADRFGQDLLEQSPDALVPVPMHGWRRMVRGTNAPAGIAACLARELGLPVFLGRLRRKRNSQPQLGLSNPARFRNVRGDLQVAASYDLEAPHVVLVDDVMTTGATCSEAARVLKRAGAQRVTVFVAARTASY